jgi:hypothetical protein
VFRGAFSAVDPLYRLFIDPTQFVTNLTSGSLIPYALGILSPNVAVDPLGLQQEPIKVERAFTQTISNADAFGFPTYNGKYAWTAKFDLVVNEDKCFVFIVLNFDYRGAANVAAQWKQAIEDKWSHKFRLCCECKCPDGMPINLRADFVNGTGDHRVWGVSTRTLNTQNWGINDTHEVAHEVGHLLGNKDEYFTVDGKDYGAVNQPGANVMNNPRGPAAAHHFGLVAESVNKKCRVVPINRSCKG